MTYPASSTYLTQTSTLVITTVEASCSHIYPLPIKTQNQSAENCTLIL